MILHIVIIFFNTLDNAPKYGTQDYYDKWHKHIRHLHYIHNFNITVIKATYTKSYLVHTSKVAKHLEEF